MANPGTLTAPVILMSQGHILPEYPGTRTPVTWIYSMFYHIHLCPFVGECTSSFSASYVVSFLLTSSPFRSRSPPCPLLSLLPFSQIPLCSLSCSAFIICYSGWGEAIYVPFLYWFGPFGPSTERCISISHLIMSPPVFYSHPQSLFVVALVPPWCASTVWGQDI